MQYILHTVNMFKIQIICLGKLKEKAFLELEKEYLKRLSPFAKVKVVELSEIGYRKNDSVDTVKAKEAEMIKKHIPDGSMVILLEENGLLRNSVDFAQFMERISSLGQEIVFIIGSGVGLHTSLKDVANYTISLSKLTFPHNFARVLLEEQIYRAWTIISGKEYHK